MAIQLVETKHESYWIVRYYEPAHKKTLVLREVPSTTDWDNFGPTGPSRKRPDGPGLLAKKPWNTWPGIKFKTQDEATIADWVIKFIITGRQFVYADALEEILSRPVNIAIRSSIARGGTRRKRYSRIR